MEAAAADEDLLSALFGGDPDSNALTSLTASAGWRHSGRGPSQAPIFRDVVDLAAQALRASSQQEPPPVVDRRHPLGEDPLAASSAPLLDEGSSMPHASSPLIQPEADQIVSRCLCGHYGVPKVELLGCGPVAHIVKLARDSLSVSAPSESSAPPLRGITAAGASCIVASPALVAAHSLVAGLSTSGVAGALEGLGFVAGALW